jgi:sensor histidine kinase regulating citrate/malate metabolism
MFWSAWRASPFKASAFGQPLESGVDVIAIQLDILSLIVAMLGIALAVIGFFGYQAIKSGAEQKAAAKADEVATAAFAAYMKNIGGTDKGTQTSVEPTEVTEIINDEKGE